MLDDKTLKSMPKVEMVRCELTGKLYPASECEVIVIKIVKWKNADINSYNPFPSKTNDAPKESVFVPKTDNMPLNLPSITANPTVESPEFNKMMHRKLSAIPPSMKDLFKKPPELI